MKDNQRQGRNPWQNLNRALQIAMLGNHRITAVSAHEKAFNDLNFYPVEIRSNYFYQDGQLWVELADSSYHWIDNNPIQLGISDEELKEVEQAKANILPTEFEHLNSSEILIKKFSEKTGAGQSEVQTVYLVAATIAQLCGNSKIRLEHVAEAIQYSKSVMFGEVYFNLCKPRKVEISGCTFPANILLDKEKRENIISLLQNMG